MYRNVKGSTALVATALGLMTLAALAAGCQPAAPEGAKAAATAEAPSPAAGDEAGAKAMLAEFVKPGADPAALSAKLRPTADDLDAVFEADLAEKAEKVYAPEWDSGDLVVAPKPGQTEVQVSSATAEELKAGTAADFPGGYKDVADKIKPGVRVFRFEFVEPGKTDGMAYDGLVYVNGAWRIAPKPWRLL